jgi:NAD(P)-dependent dehydrogenase (short-subunit alcohol dehydrogenase family)
MHKLPAAPVALITGVSSGIGRETARLLARHKFRVFGTARNPATVEAIPGVELLPLDVTSDASVAQAIQTVLRSAGQIQALVNMAGYVLMGGLEETNISEAQQQFDTNFFGVLRVTRAVLPVMRQQHSGRIVNISSVLGFLPGPYMGVYTASKHALEGYTETLDHEVREFGIRAVLVEPSFTRTNLDRNSRTTETNLAAYAARKKQMVELVQRRIAQGDDPQIVAEVIYQALTAASPRMRYAAGSGASLSWQRRFIPAGLFDRGFRKQFQLDKQV